jgi:hypothetical protein
LNEYRVATKSPRDHRGNVDVEAADFRRILWIRFYKGRSTFRIATPAERGTFRVSIAGASDDRNETENPP